MKKLKDLSVLTCNSGKKDGFMNIDKNHLLLFLSVAKNRTLY
jgi:hypothetical protein